jgi:tetratricopeptide (TPR) repeat protein
MRTASKFLALATLIGSTSVFAADVAQGKPAPVIQDTNTARSTDGRPATLAQAEADIRAGQPAKAEEALSVWVTKNSASLYRSEGLYLLGQAQFYQGKYSEAKKTQDLALDSKPNHVLKALEMFARADCNMKLGNFGKASRQYHWIEQFYRDVRAVPHDELMFKIGLASKLEGFPEWGNYWFNQVVEKYATGPWAAEARRLNTELNGEKGDAPKYYSLASGYYTDEKKAQAEAEVFKKKGYKDVEVKSFGYAETTYYEVHVGKFFNKLDAEVAKDDADLGGTKFSVRPAPVGPASKR